MVLGEVRKTFNPEFINRIDEIIVFEALRDDDLRTITRLLVKQLNDNLVDRKIRLDLAPEVVDWIIEQTCKDRSYGARPLRRAIQRYHRGPALRGAHSRAPQGRGDRGLPRRRAPWPTVRRARLRKAVGWPDGQPRQLQRPTAEGPTARQTSKTPARNHGLAFPAAVGRRGS